MEEWRHTLSTCHPGESRDLVLSRSNVYPDPGFRRDDRLAAASIIAAGTVFAMIASTIGLSCLYEPQDG